jgi:hypothetical protein
MSPETVLLLAKETLSSCDVFPNAVNTTGTDLVSVEEVGNPGSGSTRVLVFQTVRVPLMRGLDNGERIPCRVRLAQVRTFTSVGLQRRGRNGHAFLHQER